MVVDRDIRCCSAPVAHIPASRPGPHRRSEPRALTPGPSPAKNEARLLANTRRNCFVLYLSGPLRRWGGALKATEEASESSLPLTVR